MSNQVTKKCIYLIKKSWGALAVAGWRCDAGVLEVLWRGGGAIMGVPWRGRGAVVRVLRRWQGKGTVAVVIGYGRGGCGGDAVACGRDGRAGGRVAGGGVAGGGRVSGGDVSGDGVAGDGVGGGGVGGGDGGVRVAGCGWRGALAVGVGAVVVV